jgi:ABC-type nitrate/sulfonate/bicarbonate transport system substrate-binding protein
MTTRSSRRSLLPAGLAWPLAATAGTLNAQTSLLPLRVAANANDVYAQPFYPQELGLFQKAGLDVTLTSLNNEVNSSIAPSFLLSGFFTTKPFAQGNAEAIKRFAAAIGEAGRWANSHHDESAATVSTAMKIDPAVVRGMTRITYAGTLRPADLQAELDAGTRFGFLPRPFSANELIER